MREREANLTNSTSGLDAGLTYSRLDSAPLNTSLGDNSVRTGLLMSSSSNSTVGHAYDNSQWSNSTSATESHLLGRFGNVDGRRNVQFTVNDANGNP